VPPPANSPASRRLAYDGTPLPLTDKNLAARLGHDPRHRPRHFRHFLLKEIGEAPRLAAQDAARAHRRPCRQAARGAAAGLAADRGDRRPARRHRVKRILVIGQGTAAVAGQAVAAAIADALARTTVAVQALPATELSGFHMRDDMRDTLIVAVSQSGTTTDTNRTVDLVRGRGATVLAIVNRRGSDLTDKADGVLYTSDGRDVEMSVASTKAFYAQCAAGQLLALALARAAGANDDRHEHDLLQALLDLPTAMRQVLTGGRRDRRDRPRHWHRSAATGRWSATARTASPPPRSASSSASSATSRSPATRPRTRSTSTCRRNR
jgi:glucosamine--fructose-6-phosphate aminotransferase (isomerizing)